MQCLSILKQTEEPDEFRLAKNISAKMNDNGIDINKHSGKLDAQQLLHHPVSTIDQYFFGEEKAE